MYFLSSNLRQQIFGVQSQITCPLRLRRVNPTGRQKFDTPVYAHGVRFSSLRNLHKLVFASLAEFRSLSEHSSCSPKSSTPNPKPQTLNPKHYTPNPEPLTHNHKPCTLKIHRNPEDPWAAKRHPILRNSHMVPRGSKYPIISCLGFG